MDSIDISDFAFSLGNVSRKVASSTSENITDSISTAISGLISEPIKEQITNIIPESIKDSDNYMLYIIILIGIIVMLGFFAYNYFNKKNKKVTFQQNQEQNQQQNQEPNQQQNQQQNNVFN